MESWNSTKSSELYGINEWGNGYYSVGTSGNVQVHPTKDRGKSLDIYELVSTLKRRGIELPVVLRFDQIIESRISEINNAFRAAIEAYEYGNRYRHAYPIKVNQQYQVVRAVQDAARNFEGALEVGSKPELIAVLAMLDRRGEVLLCNGYKDAEYLELAILGRKLGKRTIIIIEQPYELHEVLRVAEKVGVEPELGFRMKPLSRGVGKWEGSTGENAKFGLTSLELLNGARYLQQVGKIHCLKLLHFHMGSQVSSIVAIKRVMREAARMYVEVKKLAPDLEILDVGGGLGIDYDGSKTNSDCSVNYSVEEYARDVVWSIKTVCEEEGTPVPEILSESGRSTVAHHSVLVTEVTDVSIGKPALDFEPPEDKEHARAQELWQIFQSMSVKNLSESFHDAMSIHEECFSAFMQGNVGLDERAYVDSLFRATCVKAKLLSKQARRTPEELENGEKFFRDTYFCSFSLFQSLPDSWAINQLFPIMPIHRLNDEPNRRGIIADLTCDSDGKIDRFIDVKEIQESLPLHELSLEDPYYIAIFLVGAYQETLGDLHNLFGDANAVHVDIDQNGKAVLKTIVEGDTVREVLSYVQYNPQELIEKFRFSIETALEDESVTPEQAADLTAKFKRSLDGYTYFVK
ncbi:MAG: biosynthetic arginine decarboxylase [Deltaproteobacteria bacterium]|nr:biosynthetic arginine decarboxylase [Deltaproteobacteria bacterium]